MKNITSAELRAMFLKFYQDHGHAVIASARPSFRKTTPPFCSPPRACIRWCPICWAPSIPEGTRLTDVQKCIRTGDIDEVGDASAT